MKMSDPTTFYCEVCGEDFYTYDSCVYDGLIIKCKCGVEFKIALIKVEEKDTSAAPVKRVRMSVNDISIPG